MLLISIFLISIIAACIYALYALIAGGHVKDPETESFKIILQLLLVTVIGQIATILIGRHTSKKNELAEKHAIRKELMTRVTQCYMDCKKLRRETRARSEKDKSSGAFLALRSDLYEEKLSTLNDIQLRLELIAKDVEGAQALFTDFDKLYFNLSSMEEYLNRIIDEYEHSTPPTSKIPPEIKFSDIPTFSDLVSPYKTSKFRTNFVKPFYIALDEIKEGLLYIGKNESFKRPSQGQVTR